MKRIGIIGANGQLGSEVCLLLKDMEGIEVAPICRNAVGATFLRRCGLDVRIGLMDDEEGSRRLLGDLDLIADFSLPAGSSSFVRSQIKKTLSTISRNTAPGAPLVYLSSILAFGNPDFHSPLRSYRISRSAYGSTKRYAERLVRKLCAQWNRPAYIFRVGVVHGDIQAATRQAIKDVKATAELTAYVPDCDSYTIFAFSIAEALVSAMYKRDAPGMYTLVSNPAWSWQDLHQYLLKQAGVDQTVVLLEEEGRDRRSRWVPMKSMVFGALRKQKEILNGYIGAVAPRLEQQMRATYHMRNAAADVRRGEWEGRYLPYFSNFSVYPGKRLGSLSDSRVSMKPSSERIQRILSNITKTGSTTDAVRSNS